MRPHTLVLLTATWQLQFRNCGQMTLLVNVVVSKATERQLLRTWGAICVLQKLKSMATEYLNSLDSVLTTNHCLFIFISVTECTPHTFKSL